MNRIATYLFITVVLLSSCGKSTYKAFDNGGNSGSVGSNAEKSLEFEQRTAVCIECKPYWIIDYKDGSTDTLPEQIVDDWCVCSTCDESEVDEDCSNPIGSYESTDGNGDIWSLSEVTCSVITINGNDFSVSSSTANASGNLWLTIITPKLPANTNGTSWFCSECPQDGNPSGDQLECASVKMGSDINSTATGNAVHTLNSLFTSFGPVNSWSGSFNIVDSAGNSHVLNNGQTITGLSSGSTQSVSFTGWINWTDGSGNTFECPISKFISANFIVQ